MKTALRSTMVFWIGLACIATVSCDTTPSPTQPGVPTSPTQPNVPGSPLSVKIAPPLAKFFAANAQVTLSATPLNAQGRVRYAWSSNPSAKFSNPSMPTTQITMPDVKTCESSITIEIKATDETSGLTNTDSITLDIRKVWCTFEAKANELLSNHVNKLALDGADLWVGTNLGLNRYNASGWSAYTQASPANGLLENAVTALAARDGEVWIGSANKGVQRFISKTGIWSGWDTSILYGNTISALAFSPRPNKEVYVGNLNTSYTGYSGVNIFDGVNWSKIDLGYTLGSGAYRASAIAITTLGERWIGADGAYVYVYGKGQTTNPKNFNKSNSLGTLVTNAGSFAQDSSSHMWIGLIYSVIVGGGGVVRYSPSSAPDQQWKRFTNVDGLAGNDIRAIAIDAKQHVWVASSTGLSEFIPGAGQTEGTWRAFKKGLAGSELACDNLSDLAFDEQTNSLWIASNGCGLMRLFLGGL